MKLTVILTAIGSLIGFAYASYSICDPSVCPPSPCLVPSTTNTTVIGAFVGLITALPLNISLKKK